MFKENYKACFDNIKGDSALLEKILKQADSAKDKRIKFVKIYKYAASVAAAIVVITSSVYLFNSGILKADIPEVLTEEKVAESITTQKSTQTKVQNDIDEEIKNEAKNEAKNETNNVNNNEIKPETKNRTNTSETVLNNAEYITPNTDDLAKDSQNHAVSKSSDKQTVVPEKTSVAEPTEEISVATTKDSTESAESFTIARAMPQSGAESEIASTEAISETETLGTEDTIELSIFKEGITDSPEYEYISSEKTIIAYHDNEQTKRIELTISKEEPEIIPEGEKIDESSEIYRNNATFSAVSKVSDYYILINADNISEEYMREIIQSF